MRFGAIETGGTKVVCAIGDETGKIYEKTSIPTTTPAETLPKIRAFFDGEIEAGGELSAMGVAAFGPVDVRKDSETYGSILETPKTAWKYYDLLGTLQSYWDIPFGLDTDVNAACLGEMTYGCAKGLTDVLYLTVGTGIGAGIAVGGHMVHGMLHPEAGHIMMTPVSGDAGHCVCPYHKACLEGLASGPSMEKRWGRPAAELTDCGEAWELESTYLAEALTQYIYTVSPQMLILGGGVMHQEKLFPLIRSKVLANLNGYIRTAQLSDMEHYIVPASLKDEQGILGCIRLAQDACIASNNVEDK